MDRRPSENYEEYESDGDIPDEFSDIMENEFEENEERFEPRESVSSRGTFNKFDKDNSRRNTGARPSNTSYVREKGRPKLHEINEDTYNEGSPVRENPEAPRDDESSVITEVVEEKIVNIDSDFEEQQNNSPDIDQRNKQIDEYLKMDREEYLNKEEYNNMEGSDPENFDSQPQENYNLDDYHPQNQESDHNDYHENELSPEQEVHEQEGYQDDPDYDYQYQEEGNPEIQEENLQNHQYQEEYNHERNLPEGEHEGEDYGEGESQEQEEEIKHAGLQTVFIGEKSQHLLYYVVEGFEPEQAVVDIDPECAEEEYPQYAHSPIQENEDEHFSSQNKDYPDYNNRTKLFYLANEVKKKDQGRKFVLWEQNEMRNQWDDKEYSRLQKSTSQAKLEHHWNNDITRKLNSPKSKAKNYDFSNIEEQNLPVRKIEKWYENTESQIPLLTDNPASKKRKIGKRVEVGNSLKDVPKKDHSIHNIFLQSELQAQLERSKKQQKAPLTHKSLAQKTDIKTMYAGRPIFGGHQPGNHHENANMGRARDFHSSNIF
ncbi:unnamed protein product [Moneuplotes crassus]|uniref:Uncharacterized protein n=1 Tax=Euplotes crassus TaxID=5936 RepID=A0AAD1X5T6_EUPCR|nr:unnamed protein product [Moneuplotes crassus]